MRESIYLVSGLDFIYQPILKLGSLGYDLPFTYLGFSNGLFYQTPYTYSSGIISQQEADPPVSASCYEVQFEITNPPPLGGYDPRCRPWYQKGLEEKEKGSVEVLAY